MKRLLILLLLLVPLVCFGQYHIKSGINQNGSGGYIPTSGYINSSDGYSADNSGGISLDADAKNLIDRMIALGVTPSTGRQRLYSNIFTMLKDSLEVADLRTLADAMYFTDNYITAIDTNIVKLNWIQDAYNLSSFGLLAYDSSGIKGNELSSGLRTNYVPSVNGSAYTLNSSSFGVFAKKTEKVNRAIIGGYQTGVLQRLFLVNGAAAINSASQYSSGFTDTLGMIIVSRTSSTTVKIYGDLTWVVTDTRNSSALPSVEQGLLCENANGTYTNFSAATVGFAFWCAGLDATQVRIINNIYLYWWVNKNKAEYL